MTAAFIFKLLVKAISFVDTFQIESIPKGVTQSTLRVMRELYPPLML